MSQAFFEKMDLPEPDFHLEIAALPHGAMTGRMLEKLEGVLPEESPDAVLVQGGSNSTLAGAQAASKLHIPVVHVEAGLRSYNMHMPEEINHVLSDRISTYLFCPTTQAVMNLRVGGMTRGVHLVGEVMHDITLFYRKKAEAAVDLKRWGITPRQYVVATIPRAENTDDAERLAAIFTALNEIAGSCPVVLPLHPRTRNLIRAMGKDDWLGGLFVLEPVSYLEMYARAVVTDSGGVLKEAFFHRVACITVRDETEWIETVDLRWNQLVGADSGCIVGALSRRPKLSAAFDVSPFGNGTAAEKIFDELL